MNISSNAIGSVKDKSILRKNEEIWRLGQQYLSVMREPLNGYLYSGSCKDRKCDAFYFHKAKLTGKNISDFNLPANIGGKNPGAIICNKLLELRIIYLKSLQGNENSFCIFPDNSFISTNSLVKMIQVSANGSFQINPVGGK